MIFLFKLLVIVTIPIHCHVILKQPNTKYLLYCGYDYNQLTTRWKQPAAIAFFLLYPNCSQIYFTSVWNDRSNEKFCAKCSVFFLRYPNLALVHHKHRHSVYIWIGPTWAIFLHDAHVIAIERNILIKLSGRMLWTFHSTPTDHPMRWTFRQWVESTQSGKVRWQRPGEQSVEITIFARQKNRQKWTGQTKQIIHFGARNGPPGASWLISRQKILLAPDAVAWVSSA